MKRLLPLFLVVVIGLTAAGCGAVAPYAATVNGDRISQRELDDELDAIRANGSYVEGIEAGQLQVKGSGQDTFSTAFVARVLTRQIYLQLVEQEVKKRKLPLTAEDLRQAEADVASGFREQGDPGTGLPKVFTDFPASYRKTLVERTARVSVLQQALAPIKADDAAVKEYFEANQEQFLQTCVSHLLVDTEAEAQAAKARVDAGEDFAAVATEVSKDPGSAPKGGDLGCVGKGNFVPEFETAMDTLEPGQVSGLVQTQFGFHILKVTDRKPQDLAEVEAQIRQQLLSGGQAEFDAFVSEAVKNAKVAINPRYGRFQRDGDRLEVIPPSAPTTTTSSTLPEVPFAPPTDDGSAPPPDGSVPSTTP